MRLNKYLAQCGVASRRKADELIKDGRVKVNGVIVEELGIIVDPTRDIIKVGRKTIQPQEQNVYFAFNKPLKVLSSTSDPEGRPTVLDYFGEIEQRIFPVGRLDWDSEGLLLMTSDGEFSNAVTHPTKQIPKTYLVKINGHISDEKLRKLKKGVTIPGGKVAADYVERLPQRGADNYDWIKIVISQGKNRQIRYMFEKVGFDVKKLQRVAIGNFKLGALKRGEWKPLTSTQLHQIFATPSLLKVDNKTITSKSKSSPKQKISKKAKKNKPKKLSQKEFFKKVHRKSRANKKLI